MLVIGDSILNGLAQPYGGQARASLGRRYLFVLDAAGYRRLINVSCSVPPLPPAPNALTVLEQRAGEYNRALVIGAGYNDTTSGNLGLGAAVDRLIEVAVAQGISTVVWLTYREAGTSAHVNQYRGHNDVLRQKAAEYPGLLSLADWAERSRSMPPNWFSDDGLHLGSNSAIAMADVISNALDAALGESTRPLGGAGVDVNESLRLPAQWLPLHATGERQRRSSSSGGRERFDPMALGRLPVDPSHLTVLVPVRNGAHLMASWLESVGSYADNVIALDDGSTDGTRALLEAHPLVAELLTNPVRKTYHGWDDLENRQRLVDAALRLGARWLLFLDADERIDESDARAVRAFLKTEARPGYAYGFEVFRMVEDEDHYDPRGLWVFRLFSASDALDALGSQRLHFVPVPSGIARQRWLFTSLRIQHSGSLTASHRRARFAKYEEADPRNEFQGDYSELLSDPSFVAPWSPRPDHIPVLLGKEGRYVDQLALPDSASGPAITAVVIAQNDETVIGRSVQALLDQKVDEEFEIIVVCSGSDDTSRLVREQFPAVRCVQLPASALPGEARNAGLWMARGEYITFPGSHVRVLPGSLSARLRAHDEGWDLVTASVVNGNPTPAGWASYILDHAAQLPSRPSGEFEGVPGHASYTTQDVRAVGGFPENVRAGEDTAVNRRLFFAGKRTYFEADASFAHASPSTNAAQLMRHHFQRGRALGRIIRASNDKSTRERLRATKSLPARRIRFINNALEYADADLRKRYRKVRLHVMAGAVAAATGTWYQLIAGDRTTPTTRAPSVPKSGTSGPLLVLSGRPGEAATGLLSAGTAAHAANRLQTFTRYAQTVCDVRPALAPIVTSATFTAERVGTYTIDLPSEVVRTYHAAARDIGASLLLQIQPGRAPLATILERWEHLLSEPDIGIYFDLRQHVAFGGQRDELSNVVRKVREIGGDDTIILVRGADDVPPDTIDGSLVIDLRQSDALYPHDALAAHPHSLAFIYQ